MNKKTQPENNLYNVQEAADLLGVNPGTIRRWAQTNVLTGLKVGIRGDWRFTEAQIAQMSKINNLREKRPLLTEQQSSASQVQNLHAPHLDWNDIKTQDHFVQYYENDVFLLDSLSRFIGLGIRDGDTCIVVATKLHRNMLEARLKKYGIDFVAAEIQGNYIVLDAADTLTKFMVDGLPDVNRLFTLLEKFIVVAKKKRKKIKIFGEMVSLLWEQGNENGMLKLEALWNELQKKHTFSLFCAYPMQKFANQSYSKQFSEIGETHTAIIPSESYTNLATEDQRIREIAHLQQKAKALTFEIEKTKKLEKQKDEFIALASHELKTPVTSLKVMTQLLYSKFEKSGELHTTQHLSKMNLQINKLAFLIDNLLDVSRMDRQTFSLNEERFDFDALAYEVVEEITRHAKHHEISIEGKTNKKLFADRERIGQVISNFLTNAIKYSPDADKVLVHISSNKKSLTVTVKDFGIGVALEDQKKIFERFYREPGINQKTFPGLGLGLYISSEIIKRYKGKIWVESEKGTGSTFIFTLPLLSPHVAPEI